VGFEKPGVDMPSNAILAMPSDLEVEVQLTCSDRLAHRPGCVSVCARRQWAMSLMPSLIPGKLTPKAMRYLFFCLQNQYTYVAHMLKGFFDNCFEHFFSFVFLFANNVSSIVCIVSNFVFTPQLSFYASTPARGYFN
jgi:hypothetical protein